MFLILLLTVKLLPLRVVVERVFWDSRGVEEVITKDLFFGLNQVIIFALVFLFRMEMLFMHFLLFIGNFKFDYLFSTILL